MKPRGLIQLAVVIAIGLEQLSYSLAFERIGEFMFPFSIPFKDTFGVIHRSFPMQTKYITEILHGKPTLQEEANPEPDKISGNPSVKKQHEDPDPRVEVTNITSKAKEIQPHNSKLKEAFPKVEEGDSTKSPIKIDSPEIYKKEEDKSPEKKDDDSPEEIKEDPGKGNVDPGKGKVDPVKGNEKPVEFLTVDSEDKEIQTDNPEMTVTGGDSQEMKKDSGEDVVKQKKGSFLYRLTIEIKGPGGRVIRHLKTGYLTSTPYRSFDEKVEDIQSLLKDIIESGKKIKCAQLSDVISQNAEKKDEMQYPRLHRHTSSPNARYRGQRMYHKGNHYRRQRIRPLTVSFRNYYPHKPMNVYQKQDEADKNAKERKTPETSFSKGAMEEPKLTKPRVYKYSPTVRYSSQRMDHKGHLYRYEGIRHLPITLRSYYPRKPINILQKQNGSHEHVQKPKIPESFFAEEVTAEPKPTEPETTDDTFNKDFQEKKNKAMIRNRVKSMDTPVYPIKFKSFNYNIEPPVFSIKDKEFSVPKEFNANSYGSKKTEAKRSELKEPKARSSNIKESNSESFDLKSNNSKEPKFDDDDTEDVKRIVVIQPKTKVFQDSVAIPSKESEAKIPDTKESYTKRSKPKEPNFEEGDTKGVKRIVVIQPKTKVFQDSVAIPSKESEAKISDTKESYTKSSEPKEPNSDEDNTEDVKRIVVIQPQTKVFQDSVDIPTKEYDANNSNTKESGTESSDLKSFESKEPNFDEDDTEDVKRIVVIKPQTKVFEDSVDIPQKATFPLKSEVKLEEVPVKKDGLHHRSKFYRQIWAPIRQKLLSKIFGRPAGLVIPP